MLGPRQVYYRPKLKSGLWDDSKVHQSAGEALVKLWNYSLPLDPVLLSKSDSDKSLIHEVIHIPCQGSPGTYLAVRKVPMVEEEFQLLMALACEALTTQQQTIVSVKFQN